MKLPELNDLTPYRQQLELVQNTAEQIKKDFEMFGYEIKFSGNNNSAYNELTEQIYPVIENLIRSNNQKLLSLMYKIDLNESVVKSIFSEYKNEEISKQITHIIIERELKKVVIRQYYKNQ